MCMDVIIHGKTVTERESKDAETVVVFLHSTWSGTV